MSEKFLHERRRSWRWCFAGAWIVLRSFYPVRTSYKPLKANFGELPFQDVGCIGDNCGMRIRSLTAFLVGAALTAVLLYFDSEIPAEGESGECSLTVVLGLVVGAPVFLVAGHWSAWSLALLATFAGALVAQIYYEVALQPAPRDGFELGSVVIEALFAFAFVLVSALAAGAAPSSSGSQAARPAASMVRMELSSAHEPTTLAW